MVMKVEKSYGLVGKSYENLRKTEV